MRYFLELSFDGTAYHGWQIQKNAHTVQAVLSKALETLLRIPTDIVGAGRTDTGVHANQMFCHFDSRSEIEDYTDFIYHLNALIPRDIAVKKLLIVKEDAHARFDALSRSYIYKMVSIKDPFEINKSWFYHNQLDLPAMNQACEILKTFNDFSCFSKSRTQVKTNLCKIMEAEWRETGNKIEFKIKADRFLRNMVRAIVGTMVEIGKGEMNLEDFKRIILSGDRNEAGISVPAHGLYLNEVEYPSHIFKT